MRMDGVVLSDSTAALGICQRSGLGGRARHVAVQHLWAQDSINKKGLSICKVRGDHDLSDILIKPIRSYIFNRHLSRMHFTFPDSDLKLYLCNSAYRVCTHDPLRPRGRGGCLDWRVHMSVSTQFSRLVHVSAPAYAIVTAGASR